MAPVTGPPLGAVLSRGVDRFPQLPVLGPAPLPWVPALLWVPPALLWVPPALAWVLPALAWVPALLSGAWR